MTQEELKDKLYEYSNIPEYKNIEMLNAIDDFFESHVCIPKGVNRLPDADVLHAWAEVEIKYGSSGWGSISDMTYDCEYLIKPSKPVYEWQWMYKFENSNEFQFTSYETEDEIQQLMSTLTGNSLWRSATKIEKTKRVRT